MDLKHLVNGLAARFVSLSCHYRIDIESKEEKQKVCQEQFFENFLTSIMVLFIRDCISFINAMHVWFV